MPQLASSPPLRRPIRHQAQARHNGQNARIILQSASKRKKPFAFRPDPRSALSRPTALIYSESCASRLDQATDHGFAPHSAIDQAVATRSCPLMLKRNRFTWRALKTISRFYTVLRTTRHRPVRPNLKPRIQPTKSNRKYATKSGIRTSPDDNSNLKRTTNRKHS